MYSNYYQLVAEATTKQAEMHQQAQQWSLAKQALRPRTPLYRIVLARTGHALIALGQRLEAPAPVVPALE